MVLRRKSLGFFGIASLLCVGLPTHADTQTAMSYAGSCDASAAVAIGASQFVVANDESNVLTTYRFGEPKSLRSLNLSRFLNIGKKQEADIEGAATIGARTYWITSHSRNSKDQVQASRYRLFATEMRDDDTHPLVPVGKPYTRLLRDLTKSPPLERFGLAAASRLAAEQVGGLNIEGLAATPDGRLLIGLRNPLPDDRALVVPLENPADVVGGRRATLGEPFELDLGRRGVRSIEFIGGSYLIVAGPIADEGTFALYRWSGKRADATVLDPVELGSLRPEALFAIPQTTQVQLLSDDGGVMTADVACKTRPLKSQTFRSLVLQP
jgi:hypothetical protein